MLSWDVTRCYFVSGPWHFYVSVCIHLWGQVVQKRVFEITQGALLQGQAAWTMGVLQSSETSGTTAQWHGVTTQKTRISSNTAARYSDLALHTHALKLTEKCLTKNKT